MKPNKPKYLYGRILSDHDQANYEQTKQAIQNFKETSSGLLIPEYCSGCGETYKSTTKKALYFGEIFCFECVQKWTKGDLK